MVCKRKVDISVQGRSLNTTKVEAVILPALARTCSCLKPSPGTLTRYKLNPAAAYSDLPKTDAHTDLSARQ